MEVMNLFLKEWLSKYMHKSDKKLNNSVNIDMNTKVQFISVINQLDAQNFCFTISLFHASTCFEHMCLSSGGQNCITQPLISSH